MMSQLKSLVLAWINLLLCCVPAGIAVSYTHQPPLVVFVVNFLATIPLSALLSYAIDELSMYVGVTLAGLLSICFR